MPQLNPTPWLAIFLFTWLVFLTVLPPKVLAHIFPNECTVSDTETPTNKKWDWTWL